METVSLTPAGFDSRAVVLVEGVSDRSALEALAQRRGREPRGRGRFRRADRGCAGHRALPGSVRPQGLDVQLAGLCDAGEEGDFKRGLERAGLGSNLTRADMEALGFYVCVEDLEDELMHALGTAGVLAVVEAAGEHGSFHTLQNQPAQRRRTTEEQLRRFFGTRSGRKAQYARCW